MNVLTIGKDIITTPVKGEREIMATYTRCKNPPTIEE
jgi:hypothetical protein